MTQDFPSFSVKKLSSKLKLTKEKGKINAEKEIFETRCFIAWMISAAALFGSLFFSEVLNYEPCTLCWYERMAMYPLFILLGSLSSAKIIPSAFIHVFSIIGAALSLYHYGIQKLPLGRFFNLLRPDILRKNILIYSDLSPFRCSLYRFSVHLGF